VLKVALTGNVASGKSQVVRFWTAAGVPVVRADELAREVVAPGSPGLAQVVEAFGEGVLAPDGSLDRARLRSRVFREPAERKRLEEILHPLIGSRRARWMERFEKQGASMVVAEIPLLFESGLEAEYDLVVLVVAPRDERLRRLMQDRGLSAEDAKGIMEAQLPSDRTMAQSDYVLDNGGSLEDLEIRSMALLDLLRARARRGSPR
jgi:dephospho-CoA kinase